MREVKEYMKSKIKYALLPIISAFVLAACDKPITEPTEIAIPNISADAIKSHIRTLADDAMMGREAGTEGYDMAADYVAAQMKELGLTPGGDNGGYFQPVALRAYKSVSEGTSMVLHRNGGDEPFTLEADFLASANPASPHSEVTAPLVFVGYGIDAPELGHNDYDGLDVKGKIVVTLLGTPDIFPSSEIKADYNSAKADIAAKHGAVGMLSLFTEQFEKRFTYDRAKGLFGRERMTWSDKNGKGHISNPEIQVGAILSPEAADKLFEGAPKSYQDIRTEANEGAPKGFELTGELTIVQNSEHRDVQSKNVVGILPGSDPELAKEYIILSAHLDHVGARHGHSESEDKIYNGALDNAAGIATMLEVARAFKQADVQPKRSVMFLAVTAEEKGLVGADYFANNPTVPKDAMAANVNLDMPLILYNFADVIAFGSDRSSLGPLVASAAERLNVALSPDPLPEESLFVRSDHYSFVQQGVPSVFLVTGFNAVDGEGKGGEVFKEFLSTHYHKPSDDLNLPIDFEAGAKFAQINYLIAQNIANAANRPAWNVGDYFGQKYAAE